MYERVHGHVLTNFSNLQQASALSTWQVQNQGFTSIYTNIYRILFRNVGRHTLARIIQGRSQLIRRKDRTLYGNPGKIHLALLQYGA